MRLINSIQTKVEVTFNVYSQRDVNIRFFVLFRQRGQIIFSIREINNVISVYIYRYKPNQTVCLKNLITQKTKQRFLLNNEILLFPPDRKYHSIRSTKIQSLNRKQLTVRSIRPQHSLSFYGPCSIYLFIFFTLHNSDRTKEREKKNRFINRSFCSYEHHGKVYI